MPGPPAPGVAVTMILDPAVGLTAARQSKALLASLEGSYLSLRKSVIEEKAASQCITAGTATQTCIEGVLSASSAAPGTVVVAVSPRANGMTGWTCVGRPAGPFIPERQTIEWSNAAAPRRPDAGWPTGVQSLAATCITYAGHQSGW